MINCAIKSHETGRVICTIGGHANYAPKGKDIVCAAVSALYWNLKQGLKDEPSYKSLPDGFELEAPSEVGKAFLEAFIESMRCIKEQYPKCLNLSVQ